MNIIRNIILSTFLLMSGLPVLAQDYRITDFGAKPEPSYINTAAINNAIEACSGNGGGRVVIPKGIFRSGTILMKSHVELHFENGSTLLASADIKDFPVQPPAAYRSGSGAGMALIYANGVSDIAITGLGVIDGNGAQYNPDSVSTVGKKGGRPRNILFISCNNILVKDVRMINSAMWNQHYLDCEDVIIDRIKVYNHANRNNDGIDIDGCRRFVLSNSIFDTDDDAITLKSTGVAATEDVVITNCVISSFCNAIKAGTESTGGFKNIAVSNCVIKPVSNTLKRIYGAAGGITGISLEIVDGGVMQGVTISNITIEGTACPLYIRLANRARKHVATAPEPPMGAMRNISINNLVAYGTGNYCSSITAIPGYYIEDLSLSNIQLYNAGGLAPESYFMKAEDVAEDEKGYPQPKVWGKGLPSSGLFIRHVKNIQVNGLMLGAQKTDPRVPVIADDVDGLQIKNIMRIHNSGADSFFKGKNARNISIDKPLGWEREITKIEK
ncbi:MAG: polygalacturonase [Chitinophagaceae bacterium]|nr:polygalacturonase [Chitinophagaceae bacterium]